LATGSKGKSWWKDQEQLGLVFEQALSPLADLRHDTKVRDTVGRLRQLDIGIIDKETKGVRGLVEIQKRTRKVGLHDFGGWMYKLKSIKGAKTLTALSEVGFASSVVAHAKKKYPKAVRLARIYPVDKENAGPGFTGLTTSDMEWDVTAVFYQDVDGDVSFITPNYEEPKLEEASGESGDWRPVSILQILTGCYEQGQIQVNVGNSNAVMLNIDGPTKVRFHGNLLRRLMIGTRVSHRVVQRSVKIFAYDEVFPAVARRGVCMVADLVVANRLSTLQLVSIPHGQDVRFYGQLQFHEP
jgi:hypothetical protein